MFLDIEEKCKKLVSSFDTIPSERKERLKQISEYIQEKKDKGSDINLIYICTHNSRRSHFGQVWGAVAARYCGIKNVHTYSGGTEATSFNSNAIKALNYSGFEIEVIGNGSNPSYLVRFGERDSTICFSKEYDYVDNPKENFAAIMTCSDAEENCPFIPNVDLRIATPYEDPKIFDDTALEDEKYQERSDQIALETLYIFSKIN